MRSIYKAVAGATLAAVLVAGCSSGGSESSSTTKAGDDTKTTSAETKEDIVLGLSVEETGPNAAVQGASGEGMKAAVEFINDNGGIDGRQIKVISKDTGGDVAKAVLNFKELAEEGAVAVVGPQTGGACQGVQPTLAAEGIPGVCVTPADLPEDETNVFGIGVELEQVDAAMFDRLGQENGKIGVLSQKTPLGDLINAHLEDLPDGVTAEVQQIDPTDTTAKAQLQALAAEDVGGVFIGICGPMAITAAQELVDLGYEGKIMLYNCFASQGAAKAVAGFANGNIEVLAPEFILNDVSEDSPQAEAIAQFEEAGATPDIVFASGWDGVFLIKEAIEAAGSSDPADIIAALQDDLEFNGVWSSQTITADDHRGATPDRALIPAVFTAEGTLEPAES